MKEALDLSFDRLLMMMIYIYIYIYIYIHRVFVYMTLLMPGVSIGIVLGLPAVTSVFAESNLKLKSVFVNR